MYEYLNVQDKTRLAKAMLTFQLNLLLAKAFFFAIAGISVLVWALKS